MQDGIKKELAKGRKAVRNAYDEVETKVMAVAGRRVVRKKAEAAAKMGKRAVKAAAVAGAVAATGVAVREIVKRRRENREG